MVNFRIVGTGFPFLTDEWMLYYYDPVAKIWLGDGKWYDVNHEFRAVGVNPGGYLGCYCKFYIGSISEFKISKAFTAKEGIIYEYDIASGNVYPIGGDGVNGGDGSEQITGEFTKVIVPEVPVGQDIRATLGYSALNPGALYWKTFLVAYGDNGVIKKELSATREIGQGADSEHTYTVAKMPNRFIGITFCLFAHNDAGYDWNWSDFFNWEQGYANPYGAKCLDYRIIYLEPREPEEPPIPEEGEFRNLVVSYKKS